MPHNDGRPTTRKIVPRLLVEPRWCIATLDRLDRETAHAHHTVGLYSHVSAASMYFHDEGLVRPQVPFLNATPISLPL